MGQRQLFDHVTDKGVLSHICDILDCFTPENPALGVRELSRLTNLSSSTVGRLVISMKAQGILQQNPETKQYSLGIRLLTWSGVYLAAMDIRSVSMPVMTDLQQLTRETISLYILDGTDRVCVERLESPQNVRIVARLGLRLPLHAGSAGKAILAFLPEEKREFIIDSVPLQPFTRHTILDPQVLRQELEETRQRGYAFSHGEWTEDASGVAAPVYGADRIVQGALTISGPTQRFTPAVIKKYGQEAMAAAQSISRLLGFAGNSPSLVYRKQT